MKTEAPTFYFNENIAVQVPFLLSQQQIPCVHTISAGNRGVSDYEQLEYASKNGFVLVTHNRGHFYKQHTDWISKGKKHSGIIGLKEDPPDVLVAKLNKFLREIYPTTTDSFLVMPKDLVL